MALTAKQQAFVYHYLQNFNATDAARQAKYKGNDATLASIGWENLRKPEIAEVIKRHFAAKAMSADEALSRMADWARADLGPYMNDDGEVDIALLKDANMTHLIHTVKRTVRNGVNQNGSEWETVRTEVKLHDAKDAVKTILDHHNTTGTEDKPFIVKLMRGVNTDEL